MIRVIKPAKRAFTLIELLVVITIIALLMGLIASVVFQALKRAQEVTVFDEIAELSMAVERFNDKFGAYPPNFADRDQVLAFILRAFPDRRSSASQPPTETNVDQAQALVFWLSQLSDDPRDPFRTDGARQPFYDFDESRVKENRFYSKGCENIPYVYYHHKSYKHYNNDPFKNSSVFPGECRPYRKDETANGGNQDQLRFVHPESFQIIHAGLDCHFGHGGSFPSGNGYAREDDDNITNFSSRLSNDKE